MGTNAPFGAYPRYATDAAGNVTGLAGPSDYGSNRVIGADHPALSALHTTIASHENWATNRVNGAVSSILSMYKAPPTTNIFYVRPSTAHSGTRDGTSYANAWGTFSEVVWASLTAGATLYVCGTHAYSATQTVGAHGGSSGSPVVIRGDYAPDPGSIRFTGAFFLNMNRNYTTLSKTTIYADTSTCVYLGNTTGQTVEMCTLVSGTSACITFATSSAITSLNIRNNVLLGNTTDTLSCVQLQMNTGGLTHDGINMSGNYVSGAGGAGIRISVESAAWATTKFQNVEISDNVIVNCKKSGIMLRCADTTVGATGYLTAGGCVVSGNIIKGCGTVYGASGQHGGIFVAGLDATGKIHHNTIYETYVQGAAIEALKCACDIYRNVIHDIYSGTPTANFNGGLPIDANGIFHDTDCFGCTSYGNLVYNLAGTGHANSGVAFSVWNSSSGIFRNNTALDVQIGISWGDSSESGNSHVGNTIINANYGLWKVGTATVTHTATSNTLVNCTNTVSASGGTTVVG